MDDSAIRQPPVLAYTTGQVSQTNFHKKPDRPSAGGGSGPEEPIFPRSYNPPAEFGKLSTNCKTLRVPQVGPSEGYHDYVFCRSDKDAGNVALRHGLDRKDGDEFDRAQYNPLYHQEFQSYANYDGAKLSREEKRFRDIAVHYPDIEKGIMKAPFYFRTQSFAKPRAEQPAAFARVFGIYEISSLILEHLMPRHGDLTNLFRTCQFTADILQSNWMHLDTSTNSFFDFDSHSLADLKHEAESTLKYRDVALAKTRKEKTESFSSYCIISPVRPQEQGRVQKRVVNPYGYPVTARVEKSQETAFPTSMQSHYQMLRLAHHNGHMLMHLVLHGLPWLNVAAVEAMVPEMPRLQSLSIHQCFLMNFSDTQDLLEGINTLNQGRQIAKQPHIAADFTPFYYRGPPYQADGTGHIGEFGVCPEEWEWMDTTRAVTATLIKIWDLCQKGGQDFFTPGTGFRSFLERLPFRLHTLPTILRCIAAIHDFNAKYRPGESGHTREAELVTLHGLEDAMETTLLWDLIVACNGRPMTLKELKLLVVLRGHAKRERCSQCCMRMPAYFFQSAMLRRAADAAVCHGCQLSSALKTHAYRLQSERRELSDKIFRGKAWHQKNSLDQVLKDLTKQLFPNKPIDPGTEVVHTDIIKESRKIWGRVANPRAGLVRDLEVRIRATEMLELRYHQIDSYRDREENRQKKAQMARDISSIRFQLGMAQRRAYDESIDRICRSWEMAIREYRAELAWQNGTATALTHTGRGIIDWDVKPNLITLLGATGGLADPDGELETDDQYEWTRGDEGGDGEHERKIVQAADDNGVGTSSWRQDSIPTALSNTSQSVQNTTQHRSSGTAAVCDGSNFSSASIKGTNINTKAATHGWSNPSTEGFEDASAVPSRHEYMSVTTTLMALMHWTGKTVSREEAWAYHLRRQAYRGQEQASHRQAMKECAEAKEARLLAAATDSRDTYNDDVSTTSRVMQGGWGREHVSPQLGTAHQLAVSTPPVSSQQKPTYAAAASSSSTTPRKESTHQGGQPDSWVPPHLRHSKHPAASSPPVLLPHQRTTPQPVSSQAESTRQGTQSTSPVPPNLKHMQQSAVSSQTVLLPHQRTTQRGTQSTSWVPPHLRHVQSSAPSSQPDLLHHQRSNRPVLSQAEPTHLQQPDLLPHQRKTRLAFLVEESTQPVLLPHQRKTQPVSSREASAQQGTQAASWVPPHLRHLQPSAPSDTPKLLPHQRMHWPKDA